MAGVVRSDLDQRISYFRAHDQALPGVGHPPALWTDLLGGQGKRRILGIIDNKMATPVDGRYTEVTRRLAKPCKADTLAGLSQIIAEPEPPAGKDIAVPPRIAVIIPPSLHHIENSRERFE